MKDKLKQWISKNREVFEDQEPDGALWMQIEAKLDSPGRQSIGSKHRKLWNSAVLWRAAAVVFLAFAAFLVVEKYAYRKADKVEVKDVALNAPPEVERYFLQKSEELNIKINQLVANDPDLREELHRELMPLDSAYQTLKLKLPESAHPEVVLDAMSANLMLRIELLQAQLQIISRYKSHPKDHNLNQL
jgi:hypothetical protein